MPDPQRLLDRFLAHPDVAASEELALSAPPAETYAAISSPELSRDSVLGLLGDLPGFVARARLGIEEPLALGDVLRPRLVAEQPGAELVAAVTAARVHAVLSLAVTPRDGGSTLRGELRARGVPALPVVRELAEAAARSLVRRLLRLVGEEAERAGARRRADGARV